MTYAGITKDQLRNKPGTITEKLATEFAAIKAETDALGAVDAAGLKIAKVVVTGGLANIISFAWQNPETTKILVFKSVLRVEAAGQTANAVMDVGPCASATDTGDTLMDGVALTSTGLFDNVTNKGSNGLPQVIVDENGGTNDYITGKILVANAADLTGKIYFLYTKV